MTRGLGLVGVLVSLAIGAYLFAQQSATQSPASRNGASAVNMAAEAAAATALQQASSALDQRHALNGSYAGTSLAGFGVTLVRADASGYCVQTTSDSSLFHLTGPGGQPSPGAC
jgi:hypothetical protein